VGLLAAGPCQRRTSSPAAALLVQASRRAGDDDARHSLQQNAIASVECRVVAKKDTARLVENASADANPGFGTLVSESGSASTWSENAHEFRLTPWSNDPVSDPNTEAFYIRGFGLQRGRHVIHRPSAHAGERCHDDAIGQIQIAHAEWGKERLDGHDGAHGQGIKRLTGRQMRPCWQALY